MVKVGFRIIFFVGLFVLLGQISIAQEVRATARVDSNNISIGDWLNLYIEIIHPSKVQINFPSLPDTLEGFEIINREKPEVQQSGDLIKQVNKFTITSFDSGVQIIPSIRVQYNLTGDTAKQFTSTSPILVNVRGIAVDTTKDIKDIKPPLSVPISFAEILLYLIGVIVIVGLIWLIRYVIRKRKRGESLIPEAPPRPAHEVALEALRALESERLWQRGKVKDYHSQLTDIIRTYIERRFGILAMEMTSDEILISFGEGIIPKEIKEDLREILVRADLVKFAKFIPLPEENERSLTLAYKFVESTWRQQEEKTVEESKVEVNA